LHKLKIHEKELMSSSSVKSSGDDGQNLTQSWDSVETYFECITPAHLMTENVLLVVLSS